MGQLDARRLSPDAQEQIRIRVFTAVRGGLKKSAVARNFGVSRTSIDAWVQKVEHGNITSLRSKKRGRRRDCPRFKPRRS